VVNMFYRRVGTGRVRCICDANRMGEREEEGGVHVIIIDLNHFKKLFYSSVSYHIIYGMRQNKRRGEEMRHTDGLM
jgi:hypothetical protein